MGEELTVPAGARGLARGHIRWDRSVAKLPLNHRGQLVLAITAKGSWLVHLRFPFDEFITSLDMTRRALEDAF